MEELTSRLLQLLDATGALQDIRGHLVSVIASVLAGEASPKALDDKNTICAGLVLDWLEKTGFVGPAAALKASLHDPDICISNAKKAVPSAAMGQPPLIQALLDQAKGSSDFNDVPTTNATTLPGDESVENQVDGALDSYEGLL